ncbi:MAG: hypothetical protein V7765_12795 [Oleispira sp.]
MVSLIFISLLQMSSGLLDQEVQLPWQMNIDKQKVETLSEKDVLVIKGTNPNPGSELLVIRLDDKNSHDYYSRSNLERRVISGDFELRLPMGGVKKENKERLDINKLKRIYVFNAEKYQTKHRGVDNENESRKKVKIDTIGFEQDEPLPEFVHAYDFGARHSEVLEGSQRVSLVVNNKSFSPIQLFGQMREIDRPGPEPWGRDGIAGIEELRLPLAKGLWRIVLFREDLGEWENLPRQLNLALAINGIKQITQTKNSASQWYQKEYLKFYHQQANTDPWQDIVKHRGLVQSYDFEQLSDQLSIQLLGDSPQQRFISGMILQKLDEKVYQDVSNGLLLVNQRRERYFRQHWMVEDQILVAKNELSGSPISLKKLTLAQGEGRLVEFDLELDSAASPEWESSFINNGGYVEVRRSLPRWRRAGSAQHIKKKFNHLTRLKKERLSLGLHKISIWLKSDELQVGDYEFSLAFTNDNEKIISHVQFEIEVLAQKLPINEQKVGIYLDHSPHLQFFKEWKPLQLAQVYCDLNYLERLDLRALSPPMALPTEDNIELWLKELALYKEFYGEADLLAYTPFKHLKEVLSGEALQQKMAKLATLSRGDINVYWSIADEALTETLPLIKQDAQRLHSANQFAKAAGHLNNPNQKELIESLDLILINHGFGISKREIEQMHKSRFKLIGANGNQDKRVWLYNMPDFRLAAGAFLWHSGADAYVQWHGRMPTANPYDPTDGREADYQFFYPQPRACMALPDVDRGLFELAMGQYELRWYLWLEQQTGPQAEQLKQNIEKKLGGDWLQAAKVDHLQLDQWRGQIMTLAQSLIHIKKYQVSKLSGEVNEQSIHPRYKDQN